MIDLPPNLKGRRIKWTCQRATRGWKILSSTPILYEVGVLPDGAAGRVRAEPGKVACVCQDPDAPSFTMHVIHNYPDDIAKERVELKREGSRNRRFYLDLSRYD